MRSKPDMVKLIKKNALLAAAIGMALLILIIYLIIFAPLLGVLKAKYPECRACENGIKDARDLIKYSKGMDKSYGGRMLISEGQAAAGIDELTEFGKSLGINFIEIRPGNIIVKESPPYKILPIELKIGCDGGQFVKFAASIDELEKAIVRIKSFNITPQGLDRNKFNVSMVIEIYLSAKAAALGES